MRVFAFFVWALALHVQAAAPVFKVGRVSAQAGTWVDVPVTFTNADNTVVGISFEVRFRRSSFTVDLEDCVKDISVGIQVCSQTGDWVPYAVMSNDARTPIPSGQLGIVRVYVDPNAANGRHYLYVRGSSAEAALESGQPHPETPKRIRGWIDVSGGVQTSSFATALQEVEAEPFRYYRGARVRLTDHPVHNVAVLGPDRELPQVAENALDRSFAPRAMSNWQLHRSHSVQRGVHAVRTISQADPNVFSSPVFEASEGDGLLIPSQNILVRFDGDLSQAEMRRVLRAAGVHASSIDDVAPRINLFSVSGNWRDGVETLATANLLTERPEILHASPNFTLTGRGGSITTNDPYFSELWYLKGDHFRGGTGVRATEAWQLTMGSPDVRVAIFDTGVDQFHPDINQESGVDFGPNPGVNGHYTNEFERHGTPVAGLVSAIANNGIGTAGVAPNVTSVSVRFAEGTQLVPVPRWESEEEYIVSALRWTVENHIDIIVNSNSIDDETDAIDVALEYVWNEGGLHFAASMNDGANYVAYPARSPHVIAVGSVGTTGEISNFSNYGPEIEFVAPGENLYTTNISGSGSSEPFNADYRTFTGTSAATPVAAGVAALLMSHEPFVRGNNYGIIARMRAAIKDLGHLGHNEFYGYGIPDAQELLTTDILMREGFE